MLSGWRANAISLRERERWQADEALLDQRLSKERRIPGSEHEHLLDAVQQRFDANPLAMRERRETAEHQFGTNPRMGATYFLTKTLSKVAAEMALSVLAYNLTQW